MSVCARLALCVQKQVVCVLSAPHEAETRSLRRVSLAIPAEQYLGPTKVGTGRILYSRDDTGNPTVISSPRVCRRIQARAGDLSIASII